MSKKKINKKTRYIDNMDKPDPGLFTRSEAVDCVKDGVLTIPGNKTTLDDDFAFFVVREDLPKVTTLVIPRSVTNIITMRGDSSEADYGYRNNPFSEIIVAKNNPRYCSKNGVLFTKNMDTLLCYPCGRPDKTYSVPGEVRRIATEAFLNVEHLNKICFHNNLTIDINAFYGCSHLDFPDVVKIYRTGQNILFVIHDGIFYQKASEDEFSYYMYDMGVDELDEPIRKATRYSLDRFVKAGAVIVEEHDEKCDIMYRFADAAQFLGFDDSDEIFVSDLSRFVSTFLGR